MANKVDRNTILKSGIFAFDESDELLGIKGFRPGPGKKLFAKEITDKNKKETVLEIPPNRLKLFADEIVAIVNSYLKGPHKHETLKSILTDFENELNETISRYLNPDELEPHYSNLLKKGKKYLNSSLKKDAQNMAQVDTKPNLRRDTLVASLKRSFDHYTNIATTDTFYYITHLLIGCGLEKGNHKKVFNKLFRAYDRQYN